jgi:hypothetical protein
MIATTVKVAPHQVGCHSPAAPREAVQLAPIAAHNAPHLPRYRRSQILIEQARQAAQLAIASREQRWGQVQASY